MDYKKAYKAALEIAEQWIKDGCTDKEKICLESCFSELRESEYERIRKAIIHMLERRTQQFYEEDGISKSDMFAWLEKQKENSKSTDSIPSDCVSDVKCEDGWHKVTDSLPDSTRQVLCKDAIGNFFIGRYYQSCQNWEVMMYDDYDKSNEDNPPVVSWCEIPSEKQKEQKPILEVFGFKVGDAVRLKDGDGRKHIIKSFEEVKGIHGPNFYLVEFEDNSARDGIYPGKKYPSGYYTHMEKFEEEQKPVSGSSEKPNYHAEWSEEDKRAIDRACVALRAYSNGDLPEFLPSELLGYADRLQSLLSQPQRRNTYYDIIHSILAMLKDMDFTKITPEHCVSLLNDIRVKCKDADECAAILDEPHWKPSEEQMDALYAVIPQSGLPVTLQSLYNELKKL